MGGGKGGSDFDPKGKSDNEVMRFCQSFMNELFRHIGPDTDVPAGDIGVGGREIGFLFGQYKKIVNRFCGVLTGKGLEYGGSLLRPEATGYGAVYFAQEMLATRGDSVKGKTAPWSPARATSPSTPSRSSTSWAARSITLSDSNGTIVDPDGIDAEKLRWVMELKNIRRGRIREYADKFKGAKYLAGQEALGRALRPGLPQRHAERDRRAKTPGRWSRTAACCVAEGANMPTVPEGVDVFLEAKILYGPGKAANAGGVATSGLEMTQNAGVTRWTREEVDLRSCSRSCKSIHANCVKYGKDGDFVNYVRGANIAGFVKVADAMLAQGHRVSEPPAAPLMQLRRLCRGRLTGWPAAAEVESE